MIEKKEDAKSTDKSYEESIARLESIIAKIESGVSLDDEMQLYSEGLEVAKECVSKLNDVNKKTAELKKKFDEIIANPIGDSDE